MTGLVNGREQKRGACTSRVFKTRGNHGLYSFLSGFLSTQRFSEFLQEGRAASRPWPLPGQDGEEGSHHFLAWC